MRISLNLASKPHVDLSAYTKRLRIWILILLLLSVPLFALWRVEAIRAGNARAEEDQLRTDSARLRHIQADAKAEMARPQNAAILVQSHYLNDLFRRKSFSWTAVMMDLETVLPAGVQVATMDPVLQKDGSVQIRLRVTGPRDKSVQLVRNLEHARRFVAPRLSGETIENNQNGSASQQLQQMLAPMTASTMVTFDLLAEYNPLAPPAVAEKVKVDEKAETAPAAVAPLKIAAHGAKPAAGVKK